MGRFFLPEDTSASRGGRACEKKGKGPSPPHTQQQQQNPGVQIKIISRPFSTASTFAFRFTVLISEIKKKNQNPKLSNSLNRSLRSTHTQDLLPTTQHLHTTGSFSFFFLSWVFIVRSLPISGRARANMCHVGYVGPAGKVRF